MAGEDPFLIPFSRFSSHAWRLAVSPHVCLQKCTETDLAGLGRSQAPISIFGSRDRRWSFPRQLCLQKCTHTDLAGVGSLSHLIFKLWLVCLALVISSSSLFQKVQKLNWRAWVPSKFHFRGLAREITASHVLFKFILKSVPKLIWQARVASKLYFELWLVCLGLVISSLTLPSKVFRN